MLGAILRWAGRLLALMGLFCLCITFTPLVLWWGQAAAGPWHDPRGDTLVVLAGAGMDADIFSSSSYWRTVYALRFFREGGIRKIYLTGGGEGNQPVARMMREYLVAHGVPAAVICVEPGATSTRENARFLQAALEKEKGRVVLVTSDYHMYRAIRVFRQAGLELLPRPIPDALKRGQDWKQRWGVFVELANEAVKTAYYRYRGWI